jgi:hypothetical protein
MASLVQHSDKGSVPFGMPEQLLSLPKQTTRGPGFMRHDMQFSSSGPVNEKPPLWQQISGDGKSKGKIAPEQPIWV